MKTRNQVITDELNDTPAADAAYTLTIIVKDNLDLEATYTLTITIRKQSLPLTSKWKANATFGFLNIDVANDKNKALVNKANTNQILANEASAKK